jgi:hypothetical protein
MRLFPKTRSSLTSEHSAQIKAKKHLSANQRSLAMSALRSKKALEEILDRRIGAAEQLRGVVRSIDQAKGDVEVGQRGLRDSRRVGGYPWRNAFRGVVFAVCWLPGFLPGGTTRYQHPRPFLSTVLTGSSTPPLFPSPPLFASSSRSSQTSYRISNFSSSALILGSDRTL